MQITNFKILRAILLILIGFMLITFLSSIIVRGYIDYPCFVNYVADQNCIESYLSRTDPTPKIESYLSFYEVGWHGGGCNNKISEIN